LRKQFKAFVSSRGPASHPLLATLNFLRSEKCTAFTFGGIPRGVLDEGSKYNPRDLDLVFDDEHFGVFESAFRNYVERRNNYGGLKLNYGGLTIDAWPLSSTWAFRQGLVKDISFEKLPSTVFLNIDAVIVEATAARGKTRRVYESGFFKAWASGILDVKLIENPHPAICFARTLHLAKRFGFKLSPLLATYMWRMFEETPIGGLLAAQEKHYGRVEFEPTELYEVFKKLKKGLAADFPTAVAIFPVRRRQIDLALNFRPAEYQKQFWP
jgi:hypothetical protein